MSILFQYYYDAPGVIITVGCNMLVNVRIKLFEIMKSLWHVILFLVDNLVLFVPSGKPCADSPVLIVKPDKIGDFVVWCDAACEYRNYFEGRKLVLLADKSWAPLAENMDLWDEVIPFSFSKFGENLIYRLRSLIWIRKRGFYAVIAISRSLRHVDTLIRYSSAIEKIGPNGNEALQPDKRALRISHSWYTKIVNLKKRRETTAFELNMSFIEALGSQSRPPRLPVLGMLADSKTENIVDSSYVVFVLGAASTLRRWPIESFELLAERLLTRTSYTIVLCGTLSEKPLAHSFVSKISQFYSTRVLDISGQTGLSELVSLLANAVCVVSNETGSLHLSAAVATPSICIAGGGDFAHLVPYPEILRMCGRPKPICVYEKLACYGCGWKCIYNVEEGEPAPCIAAVSVDAVWTHLADLLNINHTSESTKNN